MTEPKLVSFRKESGFTLLEMLVAVTLVAMMAVILWSVFRIGIMSWQKGTEFIDANQRHRTILDLVKRQMASIYGLYTPVDPRAGGATYPLFSGGETSVQFISLSSLRFHDNPGLTMVSYDIAQDGDGDYALLEREEQYLGFDPNRESLSERSDVETVTIFTNLISFMFEYFDPGDNQRPPQWMRQWNSMEMGRLPAAISMTMVTREEHGGRFDRHLVVPLMATPPNPRQRFVNPFESRQRRYREDDPRSRR